MLLITFRLIKFLLNINIKIVCFVTMSYHLDDHSSKLFTFLFVCLKTMRKMNGILFCFMEHKQVSKLAGIVSFIGTYSMVLHNSKPGLRLHRNIMLQPWQEKTSMLRRTCINVRTKIINLVLYNFVLTT